MMEENNEHTVIRSKASFRYLIFILILIDFYY